MGRNRGNQNASAPSVVRGGNVLLQVFLHATCGIKGDFFCQMHNNFTAYDSLHKTPSHVISTKITVHTPMSQEGIIVCLACSLYMFCAAPPNPPFIDAHSETNTSATEPLNFSTSHSFLLDLADQNLCKETPTLIPQCYDIGSQRGLSLSSSFLFICNVKAAFVI